MDAPFTMKPSLNARAGLPILSFSRWFPEVMGKIRSANRKSPQSGGLFDPNCLEVLCPGNVESGASASRGIQTTETTSILREPRLSVKASMAAFLLDGINSVLCKLPVL